MSKIDISIIIPVYNRAELISETLESVMAQTFQNWECIVIDDKSNDGSWEILSRYKEKDHRIKTFRNSMSKRMGGGYCRNYGFLKSKGRYIKFLDSDDIISNDLLYSQINSLTNCLDDQGIATCKFGYFKHVKTLGQPINQATNKSYDFGIELLEDFGKHNLYLPPHVYLIPRKLIEESGLWNENLKINQDGEFMSRLLLKAQKVIFSNEGCAYYRHGLEENTVSTLNSVEKEHHLILSWILIDSHLKLFGDPRETSIYVKNAKKIILTKVQNKEIIKRFNSFLNSKY